MGNRFTQTTLTKREQQTIERCSDKLTDIWARRNKMPNEKPLPVKNLFRAIMILDQLKFDVNASRNQINEEAKL